MLNEAQAQVTKHQSGALLVMAGAGTGKTRTLVHRYVALVEAGIPAQRILLLTFTRKAAHEMHQRAESLLLNRGIAVNIERFGGTFHSVAFAWLRKLGIVSSGFAIIDDEDVKKLIHLDLCQEEKNMLTQYGLSVTDILQIQRLTVNLQQPAKAILSRFYPLALSSFTLVEAILLRLKNSKQQAGVWGYDDILLEWLRALKLDYTETIKKSYDYIMVDEYQDTSKVQVEILKELASGHGNIMAVGDDCQSIYSFRGAMADQMAAFTKDFANAKIVKLEDNYRSSQAILDMCNEVIAPSPEVYPKKLHAINGVIGPEPKLVVVTTEYEAACSMVEAILTNLDAGIPLNQQAILFRATRQVQSLERILVKKRIPYRKFGGLKITETAHIKDFMSIISCCFCRNTTAWLRTLEMIPGIGQVKAAKILALHEAEKLSLVEFPFDVRTRLTDLFAIISSGGGKTGASLIEACLDWYKTYLFDYFDNAASRLDELESFCHEMLKAGSLHDFAADILLERFTTDEEEFKSSLIISTIHAAKGKEWDCVYIANVADGAIPLRKSSADFEEERRLLYVAMTRAKQKLYLYHPLFRKADNSPTMLSPYLKIFTKKDYHSSYQDQTPLGHDGPDDFVYVYDDCKF